MAEPPLHEIRTLGDLGGDWIQAHCRIPDGVHAGEPLILNDEQAEFLWRFYQLRPRPVPGRVAASYRYRRGQLVRAQKWGKSPFAAGLTCLEGVGPTVYAGDAVGGETYACSDHFCGCGWVYEYEPGDPMAIPRATSTIQITALNESQAANIYDALRPMIELGPLVDAIPRVGADLIRLPNSGTIRTVTSKANTRLGQRITFALQDETGLWTERNGMTRTAATQRRGLAGMDGRGVEFTNAWNPAEASVAQQTFEATVEDILRDFRQPPRQWKFSNRRDRMRILRFNYANCPWVGADDIAAECEEIVLVDPAEAERFFGNRVVVGAGAWLPDTAWSSKKAPGADEWLPTPPHGTQICIGFDGSENNDWTAIRCETADGLQFTPRVGPYDSPTLWNPAEHGGFIPREAVHAAVDELFNRFDVGRMYCDPRDWYTEIGEWAALYGDKRVVEWSTSRTSQMYDEIRRFEADLRTSKISHDGCPITRLHMGNAKKAPKPGQKYLLMKASEHQKIDAAMASILAHTAAIDMKESGWASNDFAWI
ncbi:hypothetical protein JT358_11625 [Micrococcales bacterium 31B]|nr:hypothetical protein [Micrococcales bacterium 31B]